MVTLSWRTSRGKLVIAGALLTAQAVSVPSSAAALAGLTDAALDGDVPRVTAMGLLLALLTLTALTASNFAHIAYFELGELNLLELEREVIDLANGSTGLAHHERPQFADRLQVLRTELHRVGPTSMQALLSGVALAAGLVVTAVLLARLNPWLLLLPLAAVAPLLAGQRAAGAAARARDTAAEHTRLGLHLFRLATTAGAAMELRVSGLRDEIRARHATAWDAASRVIARGEVLSALWWIAGQMVFAAAYVCSTLLVVRDAVAGRRAVGDVVLVIVLASQVNQQVSASAAVLEELQRLAHAVGHVRWARGLVAGQESPAGDAVVPDRVRHGIRFRDVGFQYPGTRRAVLAGVDLFLPAGAIVAVVGENGAGKTSLVKLLCRFYETTSGTIEVDGLDLRRLPAQQWQTRISAGFQDFARFEFLAREVVGVGDLPRIDSAAAVTEAVERVRGTDLLRGLDRGLETPVGLSFPDGTQLSGGQWQTLALGRAVMRRDPLLVVLDEPTSALDAQAEHDLFLHHTALAREVGARTGAITVLVAHRFSTVRMADLIVVMDGSRIRECGSHEELTAAGGLYAELYEMQAAQYSLAHEPPVTPTGQGGVA
ncbi:hypothetical protein A6A25_40280 [Saccharothrix sp. CB00851]|nr:hypothetical protein A6A25_40280 [Saccharothrix sp. CB00851]